MPILTTAFILAILGVILVMLSIVFEKKALFYLAVVCVVGLVGIVVYVVWVYGMRP